MTSIAERAPALPTDDTDPFAHEVLEDPLPMQAALRDAGPFVYLTRYDVYAMARYEQVYAALVDWRSSSPPQASAYQTPLREALAPPSLLWRPTRRTTTPLAGC